MQAAALSPGGERLALVTAGGELTVQRMASRAEIESATPQSLTVTHIVWFADERRLLVSGNQDFRGEPMVWLFQTPKLAGSPPACRIWESSLPPRSPTAASWPSPGHSRWHLMAVLLNIRTAAVLDVTRHKMIFANDALHSNFSASRDGTRGSYEVMLWQAGGARALPGSYRR